jgi:hypothetical protein
LVAVVGGACAGAVVPPRAHLVQPRREAVLVLPGFGYGRAGERAFKALTPVIEAEGFDLFVPTYLSRGGLDDSREKLDRFIVERQLARYDRLHVFAFIAGAWTLNPLLRTRALPNLATVIYDRSPYQERAPRVADEDLHFLTWLRYGSSVFDVARTPYQPLDAPGLRVGLVVETVPTEFVRDHEARVRSYGPFQFACDAFGQRHDDCIYLAMSHDDLYRRFAAVWPDLVAFIRAGRFREVATRSPPAGDPLSQSNSQ